MAPKGRPRKHQHKSFPVGNALRFHMAYHWHKMKRRKHTRKHSEKVVTKPVEEAAGLIGALDIVGCDYNVMLSPPVKRKRSERETPAVNLDEMDVAAAPLLLSEHSDTTSASEDCYGGEKDRNISASNGLKDVKLDASDHLLVPSDELKKPKNDKSAGCDDCNGQCKKDDTLVPNVLPKKHTDLISNDHDKDSTSIPTAPKDSAYEGCSGRCEKGSNLIPNDPKDKTLIPNVPSDNYSTSSVPDEVELSVFHHEVASDAELSKPRTCDPVEQMKCGDLSATVKANGHQRNTCGRSFMSGQALGGHNEAAAAPPLPLEHSDKTSSSEDCCGGGDNDRASKEISLKSSWGDMPMELVAKILGMLWSHRDRVRVSIVNRHWNETLKQNTALLYHGMPSLIIPCTARTLVHDTIGEGTYEVSLPDDIRQWGKICGSFEGGWIILELEYLHQNMLFNINTRDRLPLPNTVSVEGQVNNVKLLAAVLSNSPSVDQKYIVGAILCFGKVHIMASCEHGSDHWVSVVYPGEDWHGSLLIVDVIHYRGCFYYLTADRNLHVLRPGEANLHTIVQVDYDGINLNEYLMIWRQGYLLQFEQELYYVFKHRYYDARSTNFHMLLLEQREEGHFWSHQPQGLVGSSVFVGRGSSRAVQIHGFHPLSGRIQFHDDRSFEVWGQANLFQISDMGSFSFADLEVHPWPPAGGEVIPPTSDQTPPAWWIY